MSIGNAVRPKRLPAHLHIGAHKTATTHLQSTLQQCRDALAESGVGVICSTDQAGFLNSDFRAFTLDACTSRPAFYNIRKRRRMNRHFSQFAPAKASRLCISDEDIAGLMHLLFRGDFYTDCANRTQNFVRNANIRLDGLFLSVRSYETFFRSVYAYHIGRVLKAGPAEIRSMLLTLNRGWADIVKDLRRAFPQVPITVWQYESYDVHRYASQLIGEPLAGGTKLISGEANPSPSSEALDHLAALREFGPLTEEQVRYVRESFPRRKAEAPPELWTAEDEEMWRDRYARDLALIAQVDNVWIASSAICAKS